MALRRESRFSLFELDNGSSAFAQPFVKWVGGKRALLNEILARIPNSFERYFEPFVGGGAVFFALNGRAKYATIADTNKELITTYRVIRDFPDELIKILEVHRRLHSEEYYYKIRKQHNLRNPIKIAARLIYLNKTCFNGLYRVNRKGQFNVPFGSYVNPNIVAVDTIMACSQALKQVEITNDDFASIAPTPGDFVYFDPPYFPLGGTSFTSYTELDFHKHDQERLRDFALDLARNGVMVMLSNSDTAYIRSLYSHQKFTVETVYAPRSVNSRGGDRGTVKEVLIRTY